MTLEQKRRTVENLCDANSCMTCPCRDREAFGITCRFDPNTPWFKQPAHILDEALGLFGKKTVYTNFDRIKDMNFDELADFLLDVHTDGWCKGSNDSMENCPYGKKWLGSEVEE